MKTAAIVAALRQSAADADRRADEYEHRYRNARPGSAASTAAPAERRRARAFRFQAAHVEAGTWEGYLLSIGRGLW